MWLVHHGVPFHTAFRVNPEQFQMDATTRAALCIICSEFEGRKFNWGKMRFEEDK